MGRVMISRLNVVVVAVVDGRWVGGGEGEGEGEKEPRGDSFRICRLTSSDGCCFLSADVSFFSLSIFIHYYFFFHYYLDDNLKIICIPPFEFAVDNQ